MTLLNNKITYFTGVFKDELLYQNCVSSNRVNLCSSLPLLERGGLTLLGTGGGWEGDEGEYDIFPASPSPRPTTQLRGVSAYQSFRCWAAASLLETPPQLPTCMVQHGLQDTTYILDIFQNHGCGTAGLHMDSCQ